MIYIAAPYTNETKGVVNARMQYVNDYAALLLKAGKIFYSPLSHTHLIHEEIKRQKYLGVTTPSDTVLHNKYLKLDKFFLHQATEIHMLMIDGWKESKGIRKELAEAALQQIPIKYIEVEEIKNV